MKNPLRLSRRHFLGRTAAGIGLAGLGLTLPMPLWAASNQRGRRAADYPGEFDLDIGPTRVTIAGRTATATGINGTVPGPLLRFREGQAVTLNVTNSLEVPTSLHWHGLLLPAGMDGVPGISFDGIHPGDTFRYHYPIRQSGTYWYHSHSGFQEQTGVYGPLIIDPADPDPVDYDSEFVILLSDWTFEDPDALFANLKKMDDYYNFNKRTVFDFFDDVHEQGFAATASDRRMWGRMRMKATDIADVTGATYSYLMNGLDADRNWTGIFTPGEKVRLRIINGSAMTFFNLRIPGLEMAVVQTDGQNVEPVMVDELQIGVAETYDVVVQPTANEAYTVFAESMDRSGYVRGTLAPRAGMSAPVPALRDRPLVSMRDMGMDHGGMDHASPGEMNHGDMDHASVGAMSHGDMNHASPGAMNHEDMDQGSMTHGGMDHSRMNHAKAPTAAATPVVHATEHHHARGPGVAAVPAVTLSRLDEPGAGLADTGHRVLTYSQLRSLVPGEDQRAPERTLELHLTGNMERYMWSFDGEKFSEVDGPIRFRHGERLRMVLVNDTMMAHPIHLHGMFVELVNGHGPFNPKKHTVVVKPAERTELHITADEPGDWAFHCHMLYHMAGGMMRVVSVGDEPREA